jgi:pyruvate/2-oxoglutarate/acetoin dehydrogenase E1 component
VKTARAHLVDALSKHAAEGLLFGESAGLHGLSAGASGNVHVTPLSESTSIAAGAGAAACGRRAIVEVTDLAGLARAADTLADAAMLAGAEGGLGGSLVVLAEVRDRDTVPTLPAGVATLHAGVAEDVVPMLDRAATSNAVTFLGIATGALDGVPGDAPTTLVPVVRRPGRDVTLVASGPGVALALAADDDSEVLDLRGQHDAPSIAASLRRTGRAVVVSSERVDLAAAMTAAFWSLEAPPEHVHPREGADAVRAAIVRAKEA